MTSPPDAPVNTTVEVILKVTTPDGKTRRFHFNGLDIDALLPGSRLLAYEQPQGQLLLDYHRRDERVWESLKSTQVTHDYPDYVTVKIVGKPLPNADGHWLTIHDKLPEDY